MVLLLQLDNILMCYQLREETKYSGAKCRIYSVVKDGETISLFDKFCNNYEKSHGDTVKFAKMLLLSIGKKYGLREQFVKDKEGAPGDGVCRFKSLPDKTIRLYFIQYGSIAIILGDGGIKPEGTRAWQDKEELITIVEELKKVSKDVYARQRSGDIKLDDLKGFIGNLDFTETE